MGNLFLGQAQTNRIHTIQGINVFKLDPASSVSYKSFKNKHRIPFSKEKTQCCIRYPRRKIGTASKRLAILFQTVKKLHSCLIAYVGATIGRPPTYRSNAFSGTVFCKANGHGRAMLAPTRVFRQSEFHLPISFMVKWFISISSSFLHLGQKRGKLCRTVSSRILTRVLPWHTGHKSHLLSSFIVTPPDRWACSSAVPNGAAESVRSALWPCRSSAQSRSDATEPLRPE